MTAARVLHPLSDPRRRLPWPALPNGRAWRLPAVLALAAFGRGHPRAQP